MCGGGKNGHGALKLHIRCGTERPQMKVCVLLNASNTEYNDIFDKS